jgi:N-methylhydantoinase A
MLQTDIRHDLTQTFYSPVVSLDPNEVEQIYNVLQAEGAAALHKESIQDEDINFERSADMRYVGQEYSVNVPVAGEIRLDEIEESFHNAHRVRYGHSTPDAPVEFVNLRLAALGRLARNAATPRMGEIGQNPVVETREAIFGSKPHKTPVLRREWIEPGSEFSGPLIIEEDSATTVIPPGHRAGVDKLGNILITVEVA